MKEQEHLAKKFDPLPRLFEGETVYVLGGGPSLRNHDPGLLKGQRIIVTNEAFSLHPDADALVFVDVGWWQRRKKAVQEVWQGGLLIARGSHRSIYKRDGCHNVANKSGLQWSTMPMVLGGRNSGQAAINAAYLMGATRAILLGFDMKAVEGRNNYHRLHPVGGNPNFTHRYVSIFIPDMIKANEQIEKLGFIVINATKGSALECFPKRSLEWCLTRYPKRTTGSSSPTSGFSMPTSAREIEFAAG